MGKAELTAHRVLCLDDGTEYYFSAKTPQNAMEKMKYTLDLWHADRAAYIKFTKSARCWYMEHTGKTYAAVI